MKSKGHVRGQIGRTSALLVGIASAFHIYGSTESFSSMRNRLRRFDAYLNQNSDFTALSGDWYEVKGDLEDAVTKVQEEQNGR